MNINPFKFFGFFDKGKVDLDKKEKPIARSNDSFLDGIFKKEIFSAGTWKKKLFISTPPSIYSRVSKFVSRIFSTESKDNQDSIGFASTAKEIETSRVSPAQQKRQCLALAGNICLKARECAKKGDFDRVFPLLKQANRLPLPPYHESIVMDSAERELLATILYELLETFVIDKENHIVPITFLEEISSLQEAYLGQTDPNSSLGLVQAGIQRLLFLGSRTELKTDLGQILKSQIDAKEFSLAESTIDSSIVSKEDKKAWRFILANKVYETAKICIVEEDFETAGKLLAMPLLDEALESVRGEEELSSKRSLQDNSLCEVSRAVIQYKENVPLRMLKRVFSLQKAYLNKVQDGEQLALSQLHKKTHTLQLDQVLAQPKRDLKGEQILKMQQALEKGNFVAAGQAAKDLQFYLQGLDVWHLIYASKICEAVQKCAVKGDFEGAQELLASPLLMQIIRSNRFPKEKELLCQTLCTMTKELIALKKTKNLPAELVKTVFNLQKKGLEKSQVSLLKDYHAQTGMIYVENLFEAYRIKPNSRGLSEIQTILKNIVDEGGFSIIEEAIYQWASSAPRKADFFYQQLSSLSASSEALDVFFEELQLFRDTKSKELQLIQEGTEDTLMVKDLVGQTRWKEAIDIALTIEHPDKKIEALHWIAQNMDALTRQEIVLEFIDALSASVASKPAQEILLCLLARRDQSRGDQTERLLIRIAALHGPSTLQIFLKNQQFYTPSLKNFFNLIKKEAGLDQKNPSSEQKHLQMTLVTLPFFKDLLYEDESLSKLIPLLPTDERVSLREKLEKVVKGAKIMLGDNSPHRKYISDASTKKEDADRVLGHLEKQEKALSRAEQLLRVIKQIEGSSSVAKGDFADAIENLYKSGPLPLVFSSLAKELSMEDSSAAVDFLKEHKDLALPFLKFLSKQDAIYPKTKEVLEELAHPSILSGPEKKQVEGLTVFIDFMNYEPHFLNLLSLKQRQELASHYQQSLGELQEMRLSASRESLALQEKQDEFEDSLEGKVEKLAAIHESIHSKINTLEQLVPEGNKKELEAAIECLYKLLSSKKGAFDQFPEKLEIGKGETSFSLNLPTQEIALLMEEISEIEDRLKEMEPKLAGVEEALQMKQAALKEQEEKIRHLLERL